MPRRAVLCLTVLMLVLGGACANMGNPTSNPSNSANPSNPTQRPSCLPPGYRPRAVGESKPLSALEDRGQELDVKLAVVEGTVITKRRLARESGGLAPGQDPASFEREIVKLLKQRVRLLLFVKDAQRVGVIVRDSMLDNVVETELNSRAEDASEKIGQPVSVDQYLEDQGLTYDEFRDMVKEQLQYKAYVMRLIQGLGGPMRPTVDMEVSPAEVRRIYWGHPGAFDEKPGARFALFQLLMDDYLTDDIGYLDAEEKMLEDGERLEAAVRQGTAPEEIARQFDIQEGNWRLPKEDEFAVEGGNVTQMGPDVNAWLFDAARKRGDALSVPSPGGDLVVLGFLELRRGRRVPYEEAYPAVVEMVKGVRTQRLILQKIIEILSSRNAVQPPELAAQMLYDARRGIREIDSDPIAAAARFR